MAHPHYKLGAHVPLQRSVYETVLHALEHGMTALQLFLGPPQSFVRRSVSIDDAERCKTLVHRFDVALFSHAPYVYNLANPSSNIDGILASLANEMYTVYKCGGRGVILHPGSNADRRGGILSISSAINRMAWKEGDALLLENMAGQGNVLGDTLQELADMYNALNETSRLHTFFCIDTAHLWGRGEYRISTTEGVQEFFSTTSQLILVDGTKFIDRVRLIHLNDSAVEYGSHVDRHALIAEGHVWSHDQTSLKMWMDECSSRGIPMVMETDPSDMQKFLW